VLKRQASHTASLAGNYNLIRGVLKQAAVHQGDDFFEMWILPGLLRRISACSVLRMENPELPFLVIAELQGLSPQITWTNMA